MAIEGDILERIHVAIVFKQMPVWKYRGFFKFYMINFGPVLKLWNFRKRYFTATNDRQKKKKNYCETALLLMSKKLFSFRSFSKFCGCASLLIAWVILMTSSPK